MPKSLFQKTYTQYTLHERFSDEEYIKHHKSTLNAWEPLQLGMYGRFLEIHRWHVLHFNLSGAFWYQKIHLRAWLMHVRVQHRFQNISCQAGQAAPKIYWPRPHLPCHSIKQKWVTLRGLPKTLLAKQGKLGSCSACPITVFDWIHLLGAMGQVVMLHAGVIICVVLRGDYC